MKNTTSERLFLDIHAIQTVPPANINRDDTGSPKTAQFGGVTRARVSSQCWKRAIRNYFKEYISINNLGMRTSELVSYIANLITKQDSTIKEDEALKLAEETINNAGIQTKVRKNTKDKTKPKAKPKITEAPFFISYKEAEAFAAACIAKKTNKDTLQDILKDELSIDIALFGRMLAGEPTLNVDAAAQVAHAISTHAIEDEFDFYTAVDEALPEGQMGASMMDTIEYNSSTLYRYANIGLHNLYGQFLHDNHDKKDVIDIAKLFVKAFVKSMPTGKINSFAHQTLPQAVIVSLRDDRPVNMITAFEKPIKSENGYTAPSIKKLFEEYGKYDKILDKPRFTEYLILDELNVGEIDGNAAHNLNDLVNDLGEAILSNLKDQSKGLNEN